MADVAGFPTASELDGLSEEACRSALAPLFEGAPGFIGRLTAQRPFGDDHGLIAAAYQVGHELPEPDAIELVNAHPRIGSAPAGMSRMSRGEQGYGDADAIETAGGEPAWVDEELQGLNEVYEGRFGFRYVVFVAGRPRSEIIPLIEISLRNERDAELRRAVLDCVAIAEDRLRTMRGVTDDEDSDADGGDGAE
jgi:2-oxo-4-hydroxy-4-carboxy--5-ureidoimidazoline (OHCU) decarboxylase